MLNKRMVFRYFFAIFGTLFYESLAVGIPEELLEDYESPDIVHEKQYLHQETIEKQLDIASTAKYDILENVIDIPDNSTLPGPIVTNFSLIKPLNNATNNTTKDTTTTNKPKKGHIKKVYANAESKQTPGLDFHQAFLSTEEVLHSFKDYIHGVKRGLVNGLSELVNTVNGGVYVPNVVVGPVKLISNAHKKSIEALKRLHSTIFRDKFKMENDF